MGRACPQLAESGLWRGTAIWCALMVRNRVGQRTLGGRWRCSSAFADGCPLLLLSQSAVDELNQRLAQTGEAAVDARGAFVRYRDCRYRGPMMKIVEQLDLPQNCRA